MSTAALVQPAEQEAAERYVTAHRAWSQRTAAQAPAWLADRRLDGIDRFAAAGFPTTRWEAWRFTDVKPILGHMFALAERPTADQPAEDVIARGLLGPAEGHRAVFVNGVLSPALSALAELPEGIRVGSLAEALAADPAVLEAHLGRHVTLDDAPFAALNTAYLHDGAFVHVPPGAVLDRPIQLLWVVTPGAEAPVVVHPRTLIVVERGAQASVVESYVAAGEGVYWSNAVTEVVVGENANLDLYRIQRESEGAFHTATTQSSQARSSVFSSTTFAFGATLCRHDIGAVLAGEGAECTVNGLSVLTGRQHADHHTILDHTKPHCNSWEFFNGIFDERARGVFNGRIIVRPGAQKTDAKQTNNNLLLSRHARADSQPQLEIYADDVKCTHGATLGPIDQRQLFYLQSRGLSAEEARSLLTYGFAVEVLANVTLDALRRQLDAFVRERVAGDARDTG